MSLPDKQFLRRGEVRSFLGLTESAFTDLVSSRGLEAHYLVGLGPKKKRAFFMRDEVLALVKQQPQQQRQG